MLRVIRCLPNTDGAARCDGRRLISLVWGFPCQGLDVDCVVIPFNLSVPAVRSRAAADRPPRVRRQRRVRVPDRGRDAGYPAPPAQNRTCGFPAYGSHLGCLTAKRPGAFSYAVQRLGHSAPGSVSGACFAGPRFPRPPALPSADSAVGCPACSSASQLLRRGLTSHARHHGSGSSPSRCGPAGQDLPVEHEISQVPTCSLRA